MFPRWVSVAVFLIPLSLTAKPVTLPDDTLLSQLKESARILFTQGMDLPAVADPSSPRAHFLQRGEVTSRRESPGNLRKDEPYCEVRLNSPQAVRLTLAKTLIIGGAPQIWYKGWTSPQSVTLPILNDGRIESIVCRKSSGSLLRVGDLRAAFGNRVLVQFFARRGDRFPAPDGKPLTDVNRTDERLEMDLSPKVAAATRTAPQAVFQKGGHQSGLSGRTDSRAPWCFVSTRSADIVANWNVRGQINQLQIEKAANGFETLTYHTVIEKLPVTVSCYKTEFSPMSVGDVKAAFGDLVSFTITYQQE